MGDSGQLVEAEYAAIDLAVEGIAGDAAVCADIILSHSHLGQNLFQRGTKLCGCGLNVSRMAHIASEAREKQLRIVPFGTYRVLFGCNMSHMATGKKKPTVESKALSIAIRRAMATREMKTPGLAEASSIPYGTMRKILELNTVADYEQLRRIAIALNIPLSEIVADAERLAGDPEIREDYDRSDPVSSVRDDTDNERPPESDEEVARRALSSIMDLAAKHDDTEAEQEAYEDCPNVPKEQ
ncbi:hypothetical protein [Bifidobacterium simiiventris]|uniref:hypothetical protein n=1 Tax=Bifidobacterium simiiventris TaxID=2834434 RepID=UPI001F1BC9A5|nr:hypothetical protein [Bifidobacterium simiiventris]